ncbi:MAG: fumarylacetoacetate hydrolase family protein, partial [Woeseiaceae bacterium]
MKFLSFEHGGKASFGAVTDAGVVDLGKRFADVPDLRAAIRTNRLGEMANAAGSADADMQLGNITYLATIPNPEKVICIGVNYANRNAEYKDNSAAPKYPSVFMRTRESLTGHEQPLMDPPESDQLDYEGEIV